jgi:hypothetical protein
MINFYPLDCRKTHFLFPKPDPIVKLAAKAGR